MKKTFSLLAFAMYCVCIFAQEPVLSFNGDLYFIPGSMTKNGEAFLVSASGNYSFTIYDGDFNVVKTFTDPTARQPYQERIVTWTRIYDPNKDDWGNEGITRAAASNEWTIVDDQTYDYTTGSGIRCFELYSDNNNYHSRHLYVSQTLFDDDEEFEFVRSKYSIIPISTKVSDYAKKYSTDNETYPSVSYGDERIDSLMNATGADSYDWFWDEESGKQLIRLYKYDRYGGLWNEGMEIVSLDGTVKANLPSIDYISSAYYFRGKCYVEGYGNNSRVLYLLGNGTSGIRELSRTKADLTIRQVGNSLVVEGYTNEQQTIVMSTMDGRVVRSLTTKQDNNTLSLNGLLGGVYIVTLYRQSIPVKSSKIIVK